LNPSADTVPDATDEQHDPTPDALPASVRWQSWPLRDDPLRSLLLLAALAGLGALVWWVTGESYLGLLAAAAMAVALWRYFVPVTFEVGEQGIDRRRFGRQRHLAWEAIRQYETGPDGLLLLPRRDVSAMDYFRGQFIPWTTHRDEVLALVEKHLGRKEGTSGQPPAQGSPADEPGARQPDGPTDDRSSGE
jgi:hypothetical protein